VACLLSALGALCFALFTQGLWSALLFQFLIGAGLGGTYMPGMKTLTDPLEGAAQARATAFYAASFGVVLDVAGGNRSTLAWGAAYASLGIFGALAPLARWWHIRVVRRMGCAAIRPSYGNSKKLIKTNSYMFSTGFLLPV
jgi:MFS family permease